MSVINNVDEVYMVSKDVVARDVQGEFIIIPISSNINMENYEDAIFTLNNIGKAIWDRLDGQKNIRDIIKELSSDFEGTPEKIENDVIGFIQELLKRNIVVKALTNK